MQTLIRCLTLGICLANMADFLIGQVENRQIKEKLADFYVRVEDRDWTLLYRAPAAVVYQFMASIIGTRILTLQYRFPVLTSSMLLTIILLTISILTSLLSIVAMQECRYTLMDMAIEITEFIRSPSLVLAIVAAGIGNFLADVFSWSITISMLKIMKAPQVNVLPSLIMSQLAGFLSFSSSLVINLYCAGIIAMTMINVIVGSNLADTANSILDALIDPPTLKVAFADIPGVIFSPWKLYAF